MSIRKAFVMRVNAGHAAAYERRHNPIWPELAAALKEHGAANYSIFHDPATDQLFGYVEIDSEERWAAIAATDVCRRWWRHMSDIMPAHPDHRPLAHRSGRCSILSSGGTHPPGGRNRPRNWW